jgi:hypothetical protein
LQKVADVGQHGELDNVLMAPIRPSNSDDRANALKKVDDVLDARDGNTHGAQRLPEGRDAPVSPDHSSRRPDFFQQFLRPCTGAAYRASPVALDSLRNRTPKVSLDPESPLESSAALVAPFPTPRNRRERRAALKKVAVSGANLELLSKHHTISSSSHDSGISVLAAIPPAPEPSAIIAWDPVGINVEHALHEFAGPQLAHLVNMPSDPILLEVVLPTLRRHFGTFPDRIFARRNTALRLGAAAFNKPFLLNPDKDSTPTPRAVIRRSLGCLRDDFDALDDVLASIEVAQLVQGGGPVYRLRSDRFAVLKTKLVALAARAQRGFGLFAPPMPAIPTWGVNDNFRRYFDASDFEILGVCFRAEVEYYVETLARYFDFSTNAILPPTAEIREAYEAYLQRSSIARGY